MHAGHHDSLKEIVIWMRRETLVFLLLSTLPWLPIAMIGTAVAFLTGFKNNASYSRLCDARQIYGTHVLDSAASTRESLLAELLATHA